MTRHKIKDLLRRPEVQRSGDLGGPGFVAHLSFYKPCLNRPGQKAHEYDQAKEISGGDDKPADNN